MSRCRPNSTSHVEPETHPGHHTQLYHRQANGLELGIEVSTQWNDPCKKLKRADAMLCSKQIGASPAKFERSCELYVRRQKGEASGEGFGSKWLSC